MSGLPRFKKPTERRARNMRAIRSAGNSTTERRLASLLRRHGLRGWKLQARHIVGRPDLVIQSKRIAVFVDGCFWHGCPHCGHIPRTNRAYWLAKIAQNKRRDRAVSKALRALGYRVVRIWECQLRVKPEHCFERILSELNQGWEKGGLLPSGRS